MWCGAVWCGVVRCGVVRCGVVWCGVVWCGESFIFSESNLRSTLLHTDSPSKLLPTTSLLPLSFSFSLTPPHHHLPHTDHPTLLSLKPSFPALPPKPTPSPSSFKSLSSPHQPRSTCTGWFRGSEMIGRKP